MVFPPHPNPLPLGERGVRDWVVKKGSWDSMVGSFIDVCIVNGTHASFVGAIHELPLLLTRIDTCKVEMTMWR